MPLNNRKAAGFASLLILAGCGSFDGVNDAQAAGPRLEPRAPAPAQDAVKVGDPYVAEGQTYTPADEANYDEVGYASWYGDEMRGNKTGNGEMFNPQAITAAHRTLPMPSFVEVTNLDTGRTILVRINDRGPFAKDRIIDLSQGAAHQLGVDGQGRFPVRVRRVNPPEHERIALSEGNAAAERLPTPPALLNALRKHLPAPNVPVVAAPVPKPPVPKAMPVSVASKPAKPVAVMPKPVAKVTEPPKAPAPKPVAAPKPADTSVPVDGRYYIQVGSFSTEARAKTAAGQVKGSVQAAGRFWRVRSGPYASEAAAKAALGPVAAKGYRDARITR